MRVARGTVSQRTVWVLEALHTNTTKNQQAPNAERDAWQHVRALREARAPLVPPTTITFTLWPVGACLAIAQHGRHRIACRSVHAGRAWVETCKGRVCVSGRAGNTTDAGRDTTAGRRQPASQTGDGDACRVGLGGQRGDAGETTPTKKHPIILWHHVWPCGQSKCAARSARDLGTAAAAAARHVAAGCTDVPPPRTANQSKAQCVGGGAACHRKKGPRLSARGGCTQAVRVRHISGWEAMAGSTAPCSPAWSAEPPHGGRPFTSGGGNQRRARARARTASAHNVRPSQPHTTSLAAHNNTQLHTNNLWPQRTPPSPHTSMPAGLSCSNSRGAASRGRPKRMQHPCSISRIVSDRCSNAQQRRASAAAASTPRNKGQRTHFGNDSPAWHSPLAVCPDTR